MVPMSHRMMIDLITSTLGMWQAVGETEPIRTLNILPMHMLFGATLANVALATGGYAACMPAFEPQRLLRLAERL